ncbi:MAG: hypothetical protein A2V67_08440 [Deltaproteobacteria bacterium RBG_13_61_14]|nr:MAG: hypothetical protein A2V67_08440 [Deltaproteobacteria bacterium RBG_13_61_14]
MAEREAQELTAIREFLNMLRHQDIRVDQAYWFGSRAQGQGTRYSDLDVAVISPDLSGNRFRDSLRIIEATPEAEAHIEVHPFRPEDFTEDDPFAAEIMRTGIRIE